jgi:beta-lactamase superfamily II metal-dependent hydrolase
MNVSESLPEQGVVFWPVGTGDSTTIVIDDHHVVQVDLHDMVSSGEEGAVVTAVVDQLVESLPRGDDGRPYLAGFILTHADKDHVLGFTDLIERVTIGEIWATPRLWREQAEAEGGLCADAEAFHKEAARRVEAVKKATGAGLQPASGDRIRVIGYDVAEEDHDYSELPAEYLSRPGEAVSRLDGEDLADRFEVFIHAPFKDDCAAERNATSLAMQVTLKDGTGHEGHALLLGDLAYETITKIFSYSEYHGRPERLAWEVLLAPHHCSKRVMYIAEGVEEVLKQDVLDALSAHAAADAVIVVSSSNFRSEDEPGDNPPHIVARNRYEELVDEVIVTAECGEAGAPQPVVFTVGPGGLALVSPIETVGTAGLGKTAGAVGLGLAIGGLLALLVERWAASRRERSAGQPSPQHPRGLDRVRQAVRAARGEDAAPQQPVGFGRS